ncbi:copper chaperone PCu(A)C [Paenirhodobacter sp.]|uniref:copper chaperone PCu(A)C n=1 Tax=Paenirhodobacter sp. TaxID=1965326 RepID=UPI003B426777
MIIRTFLAAALIGLSSPALLAHEAPVTAGDLTLSGAFTRATRPGAPVAGGFLTIRNAGAEDRLTGGSAPFAAEVQVHEMAMEGDVMKMRALPDGLPVPAGQEIALKPGGHHLMFIGLKAPLVEGETVPVTLTFAKAGAVTVPLKVLAPGARGMEH